MLCLDAHDVVGPNLHFAARHCRAAYHGRSLRDRDFLKGKVAGLDDGVGWQSRAPVAAHALREECFQRRGIYHLYKKIATMTPKVAQFLVLFLLVRPASFLLQEIARVLLSQFFSSHRKVKRNKNARVLFLPFFLLQGSFFLWRW
jgi:hypothetical protein